MAVVRPVDRVDPVRAGRSERRRRSIAVVAIGLVVTLAASLEPARRAGSISPVEALKARLDPASARRARLRWLVARVRRGRRRRAARLAARRGRRPGSSGRPPSTSLLLRRRARVAGPCSAALGRIAGPAVPRPCSGSRSGWPGPSLARDRSRTALTVGALTVGLAMVVAIGGVADQSRLRPRAPGSTEVIPGDELADLDPAGRARRGGRSPSSRAIDGVARVSPIATFEVARDGVRTDAAAVVGADLLDDGRLRFVAGDRDRALDGARRRRRGDPAAGVADRDELGVGSDAHARGRRTAGSSTCGSPGSPSGRCPGRAARRSSSAGATRPRRSASPAPTSFAVRYEPGREADARPARRARRPASSALEPNPLATRRRARSTTRSAGSSACSTRWRSSRSSSPRSASSTRSR